MSASWAEQGFTIVPGLFGPNRIAPVRSVCAEIREDWLARDPLTGRGSDDSGSETCMRHVNHPAYFSNRPGCLRDVLEICADECVVSVLRRVWGEEPVFRSTSLFFNPKKSNQAANWHRDSQFTHQDVVQERKALAMAALEGGEGVQIQIPLIDDDALHYVPGSHRRWDTDEELNIRRGEDGIHCYEPMPGALRIAVSAGDAVFFDPNGIHRGSYNTEPSRLTLMVTYTRISAPPRVDRFSYQPWFLQDGYLDGISPASRAVYDRFVACYSALWSAQGSHTGDFHSGRRSRASATTR